MRKEEVVAHIIMENVSDPVDMNKVDYKSLADGLTYARFPSRLQSFNVRNRNGREYEGNCMMQGLNAEYIREMIQKGTWCCELGHPITKDPARIVTIDPKNICARITSLDMNYNGVNGWVETLLNDHGQNVTKMMMQGFSPAFSLRALANITRTNGRQIVKNGVRVVNYDLVILPSHKDAYIDTSVAPEYKSVRESILEGTGINVENDIMGETSISPVLESQFLSVLESTSVNLKETINQQEVVVENMSLSKDMRHVILEECGRTFLVKIEDKISNDIINYMERF